MASERYSECVQKITREGGAGSMEKPKIAFDVDGVLGDFLYQYSRYHKKIYPDRVMRKLKIFKGSCVKKKIELL